MNLPALVLLAAALHPAVPPGALTFHARMTADTFYCNETVWVKFEAENLTDVTLPVVSLSTCSPAMLFDILDSAGQSVLASRTVVDYFIRDSDTLTPRGRQSALERINFGTKFHDSLSGENYFPPGLYLAKFRWPYLATREIVIPRPYLEDSVEFRVVAPVGVEAEARDAFRKARAQRCPEIATALWSSYQTYNKSHYADECLDDLLIFLGDPKCDASKLNRETVAMRLVLDCPNHPTVLGNTKVVYLWSEIHKSRAAARRAMQAIIDSVPANSGAAEAARKFLREGIPKPRYR